MRGSGRQHPGAEVRESFCEACFVHRPEASLAPDKNLLTVDSQIISLPLSSPSWAPQIGPPTSLAKLPQLRTQVLFLSVHLAHGANNARPQAS